MVIQSIIIGNSEFLLLLHMEFYLCLVYIMQQWNGPSQKNQRVLICTDDMMIDFYAVDADCLIHYDIPANKHKFSMRFSVLQSSSNVIIVSSLN